MCNVAAGAVGDGWNALKRIEVGRCLLDLSVGILTQCSGPEVDLMPRLAVCLCGAMAQAVLQPLQHYNRCCVFLQLPLQPSRCLQVSLTV